MIIAERPVSILDTNAECVTCTVNCQGHMGRGVALYLRKAIPGLYPAYRQLCEKQLLTVDKLWIYRHAVPRVLCFPTKDRTWEPSRVDWIEHNLIKLRDHRHRLQLTTLAIPPLGCANGGLSWSQIRPMIYDYLDPLPDLQVYICLGRDGGGALCP